ncbi:hypothetical protein CFP56_042972 [Quercus suber]|uniref:Uncharacterized protein n=1 Tax=Quercus suber TaxID=58331 RepID=A0AAW0IS63_QUESU
MILSMFPISSRETSGLFLCKLCSISYVAIPPRSLLYVGKNPHESDFLRKYREKNGFG